MVETYPRQLKNHILPAMGEVRLGESTTLLVDRKGQRPGARGYTYDGPSKAFARSRGDAPDGVVLGR